MNIKVLVETLTEIPEVEMLNQLISHFKKHQSVTIPDLKKVFNLLSALFSNRDREIVKKGLELTKLLCSFLVTTEVEQAWLLCGPSLIKALGFQDNQIRKMAKESIMIMLKKTNNPLAFLDSLNKIGLQNELQLVVAKSMKVICNILEYDVNILSNKASIGTVKTILEKLISFTKSQVPLLQQKSRSALIKIFYIGVKNLEQIILRLDGHFRQTLQALWMKEKQQLGQANTRESKQLRFQQFPMVSKKIFGVFDPNLFERLIKQLSSNHYGKNAQQQELLGYDARKGAILQFKLGFQLHFDKLVQFLLPLYRLLVKLLSQELLLEDVVDMIMKVFQVPAIKNRVVLSDSIRALVLLLNSEKVTLRKKIKAAVNDLMPTNTFKFLDIYQQTLDSCRNDVEWYCIYEVLDLVQDLLISSQECYPPIFDAIFHSICFYLDSEIVRVRNKSLGALCVLVNFHPSYRETINENCSPQTIGIVEDRIEQKDIKGFGKQANKGSQPETEYDIDFEKQRQAYLQYLASKGHKKKLD